MHIQAVNKTLNGKSGLRERFRKQAESQYGNDLHDDLAVGGAASGGAGSGLGLGGHLGVPAPPPGSANGSGSSDHSGHGADGADDVYSAELDLLSISPKELHGILANLTHLREVAAGNADTDADGDGDGVVGGGDGNSGGGGGRRQSQSSLPLGADHLTTEAILATSPDDPDYNKKVFKGNAAVDQLQRRFHRRKRSRERAATEKAANAINSASRGYLDRARFRRMNAKATEIQKMHRAHQARVRAEMERQQRVELLKRQQREAAGVVQRNFRKLQSKKAALELWREAHPEVHNHDRLHDKWFIAELFDEATDSEVHTRRDFNEMTSCGYLDGGRSHLKKYWRGVLKWGLRNFRPRKPKSEQEQDTAADYYGNNHYNGNNDDRSMQNTTGNTTNNNDGEEGGRRDSREDVATQPGTESQGQGQSQGEDSSRRQENDNNAKFRKMMARIKMRAPMVPTPFAFCALSEMKGNFQDALDKLMSVRYTEELSLVCRALDVESYLAECGWQPKQLSPTQARRKPRAEKLSLDPDDNDNDNDNDNDATNAHEKRSRRTTLEHEHEHYERRSRSSTAPTSPQSRSKKTQDSKRKHRRSSSTSTSMTSTAVPWKHLKEDKKRTFLPKVKAHQKVSPKNPRQRQKPVKRGRNKPRGSGSGSGRMGNASQCNFSKLVEAAFSNADLPTILGAQKTVAVDQWGVSPVLEDKVARPSNRLRSFNREQLSMTYDEMLKSFR